MALDALTTSRTACQIPVRHENKRRYLLYFLYNNVLVSLQTCVCLQVLTEGPSMGRPPCALTSS